MNDLERRLRAAMSSVTGPAPAGLMAGIRRRRRRHLVRLGAGCAALIALLAMAAVPVTHALRPAAGGASSPESGGVTAPGSPVRAAPGTVLRDCASENGSGSGLAGYQAHSVRAGPVWFVGARQKGYWPASRPLGGGQVQAVGVPVVVQAGAVAVVRAEGAASARFRFLAGFNDTNRYTVRDGQPGVTLAACPASVLGPVTMFWVGYLNDGLACVPFQVTEAGHRPVRVALSASGGTCTG